MSYKLDDLNEVNQFDFHKETRAILEYILKTWDITAAPKGYDKFMKDYHDHDGQEEVEEQTEALLKSFKGHAGDFTTLAYPFPVAISCPFTGYDDRNQVNGGPLEVLISAIMTHCVQIGMRLEQLNPRSDAHKRTDAIRHALNMCGALDDTPTDNQCAREIRFALRMEKPYSLKEMREVIKITYHSELMTYLKDNKKSTKTIQDEFNKVRRLIARSQFLCQFKKYIKKHNNFVVYHGMTNEILKSFYVYFHDHSLSNTRKTELKKDMDDLNVKVIPDGQYAFKVSKKQRRKHVSKNS